MIKRRSREAGLPAEICCYTVRATGITAFLKNGGDPQPSVTRPASAALNVSSVGKP